MARTQRRTHQTTTTVATVRPYVPGDPLRAIDWRKTAHVGGVSGGVPFMVKQFDLEPSGDLWIVLDLDLVGHVGQGTESTLEYAVTLTASLATQMLAENRRVGLAAPGCQLPPQSGQLQLWRILEALAQAEPVPGYPLDRLLRAAPHQLGPWAHHRRRHPVHRSSLERRAAAPGRARQRARGAAAGRGQLLCTRCAGAGRGCGPVGRRARPVEPARRAQPFDRPQLRFSAGVSGGADPHRAAHALWHGARVIAVEVEEVL